MADSEAAKEVSEKEKETAQEEEKEKDTAAGEKTSASNAAKADGEKTSASNIAKADGEKTSASNVAKADGDQPAEGEGGEGQTGVEEKPPSQPKLSTTPSLPKPAKSPRLDSVSKGGAKAKGPPSPKSPVQARTASIAKGGDKGKGPPAKGGKAEKGKKAGENENGSKKGRDEFKMDVSSMSEDAQDNEPVLPPNCAPLFLTSRTQDIYNCKCDEDVTADNPYKIITKQEIIDDMVTRAAVCDFHPFKMQIQNYPGDEILIVYDYEFKFGQNFYIALTEEAKEFILNPPGEEEEKAEDVVEEVVYRYIPPEPKIWKTFGSEAEIEEENVVDTRVKVKFSIKRQRRYFGAPCTFTSRGCDSIKQGVIECTAYEDKNFDLMKLELASGTQAVPHQTSAKTQTDWKYPRNNNTQYYPREYPEEQMNEIASSEDLAQFVKSVEPRFELALQQNAIMNVFYDDWVNLGEGEDALDSKAESHLKEFQSFTDLSFSKDKTISCIQWHPSIKGVAAVSVTERMTFDERVDQAAKVIMTPSLILIWSFIDPILPQLILEAPEDIFTFCFCPTDHNVLAGGCYNGQIVLWDISAHEDRLKTAKATSRAKRTDVLPGFEDPNALKTPVVRYCAVSSIEHGHKACITDIQWMPDHFVVSRMGVPLENKSEQCHQLITCATDNCVLFWETRPPKGHQQQKESDKSLKNPMGVPNTFKHLDLTWKPHLKMFLSKSEPGGDHAPIKFSMQERQGDRSVLLKASEGSEKDMASTMTGAFTALPGKPGSGKERTLHGVQTYLFIGTEDGEVVYGDWMPQKDQDTGKLMTPKPTFYHTVHDGPVTSMTRSPFLKEVVLAVGGWVWSIWKEGVSSGPILLSAACPVRLGMGCWSPSRPSVFFISKHDGSIDIWDLLDKTHEPSLTQSVSPTPITAIFPHQVSRKQQLLAVGDNSGTLHILEIPQSLRQSTPGELNGMTNYIEREVKRRAFVMGRWAFREQEKQEKALEAKKKAGIAPNVQLTDEEIEMKQKLEYQNYLNEEYSFLRELGIVKDEEELGDRD